MADGGFFRGTSAEQDARFLDKQKKLRKQMKFEPILETKVNYNTSYKNKWHFYGICASLNLSARVTKYFIISSS